MGVAVPSGLHVLEKPSNWQVEPLQHFWSMLPGRMLVKAQPWFLATQASMPAGGEGEGLGETDGPTDALASTEGVGLGVALTWQAKPKPDKSQDKSPQQEPPMPPGMHDLDLAMHAD